MITAQSVLNSARKSGMFPAERYKLGASDNGGVVLLSVVDKVAVMLDDNSGRAHLALAEIGSATDRNRTFREILACFDHTIPAAVQTVL